VAVIPPSVGKLRCHPAIQAPGKTLRRTARISGTAERAIAAQNPDVAAMRFIMHIIHMNTRSLLLPLAIGLTMVLCSCPETTVPITFGTSPLKLSKADWNGKWTEAGKPATESIVFTVSDAAKGRFTAQGSGKDDKPIEVLVHSAGAPEDKLCFLTYIDKPTDSRGPLRLVSKPKDGVFLLWDVNHAEIQKAIKSGELKGRLVKGDKEDHKHSEVDADVSNYGKLLEPRFWNWSEPETFVRSK
jgi:hypothetical protein